MRSMILAAIVAVGLALSTGVSSADAGGPRYDRGHRGHHSHYHHYHYRGPSRYYRHSYYAPRYYRPPAYRSYYYRPNYYRGSGVYFGGRNFSIGIGF